MKNKQINSEEVVDRIIDLVKIFTEDYEGKHHQKGFKVGDKVRVKEGVDLTRNHMKGETQVIGMEGEIVGIDDEIEECDGGIMVDFGLHEGSWYFYEDMLEVVEDGIDWDKLSRDFHLWHIEGGFPPSEKVFEWFKERLS